LHDELGLPDSALLVGAIGQLGVRKGLDVLLAAASLVALERNDVHFLLVGRRHSAKHEAVEFERAMRVAADTRPLAGRVHFLGERGDVPHLLNELALLVHAALQEPLGRVLLEAAASGCAIVAADVGGTREIFPIESMARIVPPDDPAELAHAVHELLADRQARQALGAAARKRAEDAFDIQRAAAGLAAHYRIAVELGAA
jgi:glycosyltransferase involved in cell wall biosynthesis